MRQKKYFLLLKLKKKLLYTQVRTEKNLRIAFKIQFSFWIAPLILLLFFHSLHINTIFLIDVFFSYIRFSIPFHNMLCLYIIFNIVVKYQIELFRFISFTLMNKVDLSQRRGVNYILISIFNASPKRRFVIIIAIYSKIAQRQYNDKINCHDITVIYYKYATITVQHRISHKRDQIKRFGPTNKSSVSGGRGTNLSQWVFLRAKYMLWVNEFASRLNRVNLLTSAILIFSYVTCFLINSNLLVCNCKKHKEQTKNLRPQLFNKIAILQITYTIESRVNHLLTRDNSYFTDTHIKILFQDNKIIELFLVQLNNRKKVYSVFKKKMLLNKYEYRITPIYSPHLSKT